jgi:exopolysaccharide production protein ExoQ
MNCADRLLASQPRLIYDGKLAVVVAAMFWILLAYIAIPPDFLARGEPRDPNAVVAMAAPNPVSRAIKMGLLGLGVIFIAWRASLSIVLLRHTNPFFLAFLTIVPISALWSIESGATIARFISIVSVVVVCFAVQLVGWHKNRFQNVARPIVTLLLLASLLIGMVAPVYVTENDPGSPTLIGSWGGIVGQKNLFGQLAGFGIIFWLNAWLAKEQNKLVTVFGLAISITCLVLSRSATSILAATFSMLFMLLLLRSPQNLRRYMPIVIVVFATIVLTYALAVLKIVPGLDILLTPITAITGKDMTFSNRSEIWVIIKENVALHPWLGSGYGAYWIGPVPSSPSYAFLTKMYFYPTQSHNGYLEVVNDLGFFGFGVLAAFLATYVRQSLQIMKFNRNLGALYLGLFFQQIIVNLSEATWLQINVFIFIVMTTATFSMGRTLLERKLQSFNQAPVPPVNVAYNARSNSNRLNHLR